jgi:hypothetical protein
MIESKLAFFEMQVELLFPQPFELRQPILCKAPKSFDPVDVTATMSEFILGVMYAKVLLEAKVHQAVVALPAIGMNHGLNSHTASYHPL